MIALACGLSGSRARSLVRTAMRMSELPETRTVFAAGELNEDQVAVISRHAPASIRARPDRRVLGSHDRKEHPTAYGYAKRRLAWKRSWTSS